MKPVEFPGVNVVFAKDQPEYVPLPAMKVPDDPQGLIITKWELSPDELKRIQETGTIPGKIEVIKAEYNGNFSYEVRFDKKDGTPSVRVTSVYPLSKIDKMEKE